MYRPEGWQIKDGCETCASRDVIDGCTAPGCYDDGFEAGADAMQVWVLVELTYIMRPIHTLLQREELLNNLVSQLRG